MKSADTMVTMLVHLFLLFLLNNFVQPKCKKSYVLPVLNCANNAGSVFKAPAQICFSPTHRLYVNVQVGVSYKATPLFLDTGASPSFALLHSDVPDISNYIPSGFVLDPDLVNVTYVVDSVMLRFYKETISIVDKAGTPTFLTDVAFGAAPLANNPNIERESGVLGLSTHVFYRNPAGLEIRYVFLREIYDQLNKKMFSLWLSEESLTGYFSLGQPLPGCYNHNHVTTKLHTLNAVTGNNIVSWQVKGSLTVRFPETLPLFVPDMTFFLDTGVTAIGTPPSVSGVIEARIHHRIDRKFKYPMVIKDLLPTFVIEFKDNSGLQFVMEPNEYIKEDHDHFYLDLSAEETKDRVVLGFPFLLKYYTEYWIGENKVDEGVVVAQKLRDCKPEIRE